MVYWADYGFSTISRCDEWGGSAETLLTNLDGLASPIGLALDIENRYLYFTDEGNLAIGRCSLDGSGLTLITGGLVSPHGIAYHHGQNKIYWATWETGTGNIMRCNIDGSNQEVLISPLEYAAGICLDEENDYIYYTFDFELHQCRTDGTQDKLVTPISNIPFIEFGYFWLEPNNNLGFPEFPSLSF
jgi:sugar lactone lactonase YvrE